MRALFYSDLGTAEFSTALEAQERLLERKQREGFPDVVLFVEHPHVYTIGRGGKAAHVIAPGEIPVIRTSRGGDVTYHGPGQLVAYPIVDLKSKLRKAVHRYLHAVELSIIGTVAAFGLRAERRPPWTGVWIGDRKIASIGVAVKRGVTYHGLAINVNTDLSRFRGIIPCGLGWAEMTSIEKELGCKVSMEDVKQELLRQFVKRLGYTELEELCPEIIQTGSRPNSPAAPITFA
jgi:lipoate-protein ligase B